MVASTFYVCSSGTNGNGKEPPFNLKAAFDEEEDMSNQNPEQ